MKRVAVALLAGAVIALVYRVVQLMAAVRDLAVAIERDPGVQHYHDLEGIRTHGLTYTSLGRRAQAREDGTGYVGERRASGG